MIEKNKTYTYEDLEKIIKQATQEVLTEIDRLSENEDIMAKMMIQTEAMLILSLITNILLNGDINGHN